MAKIDTLQDALTDNSMNTSLWDTYNNGAGTATEANNRLELNCGTASGNRGGYQSDVTYDLDESSIYGRFSPNGGSNNADRRLYMAVLDAANDGYFVFHEGNQGDDGFTYFKRYVAGADTANVGYVFHNFSTHQWWRIREASGVIYFDTAPDGVDSTVPGTWTNRASEATNTNANFDHTAVIVRIVAQHYIDNSIVGHVVGINTAATIGGGGGGGGIAPISAGYHINGTAR